ncbi:DNA-directed RNA polymerase I subunit RPA1 [Cichlidogyrus casuarinus]|uniref:DNA-directed RNA polymerase n=1 Tax=Cichlidogyrus casuarinus TaxID=1844966 RepID=A0ABD2QAK4_9PLAT
MDANTNCRIDGLNFSLYTAEEIRSISVKEIVSANIFDRFSNRTVDGGLHDQHLGPNSFQDICEHCGLTYTDCNGHFGRIEFPKPVYNPLFFENILKSLKSFCPSCYCFYQGEISQTAFHLLGVKKG